MAVMDPGGILVNENPLYCGNCLKRKRKLYVVGFLLPRCLPGGRAHLFQAERQWIDLEAVEEGDRPVRVTGIPAPLEPNGKCKLSCPRGCGSVFFLRVSTTSATFENLPSEYVVLLTDEGVKTAPKPRRNPHATQRGTSPS
jgi:hypothetical protein